MMMSIYPPLSTSSSSSLNDTFNGTKKDKTDSESDAETDTESEDDVDSRYSMTDHNNNNNNNNTIYHFSKVKVDDPQPVIQRETFHQLADYLQESDLGSAEVSRRLIAYQETLKLFGHLKASRERSNMVVLALLKYTEIWTPLWPKKDTVSFHSMQVEKEYLSNLTMYLSQPEDYKNDVINQVRHKTITAVIQSVLASEKTSAQFKPCINRKYWAGIRIRPNLLSEVKKIMQIRKPTKIKQPNKKKQKISDDDNQDMNTFSPSTVDKNSKGNNNNNNNNKNKKGSSEINYASFEEKAKEKKEQKNEKEIEKEKEKENEQEKCINKDNKLLVDYMIETRSFGWDWIELAEGYHILRIHTGDISLDFAKLCNSIQFVDKPLGNINGGFITYIQMSGIYRHRIKINEYEIDPEIIEQLNVDLRLKKVNNASLLQNVDVEQQDNFTKNADGMHTSTIIQHLPNLTQFSKSHSFKILATEMPQTPLPESQLSLSIPIITAVNYNKSRIQLMHTTNAIHIVFVSRIYYNEPPE